MRDIAKPPTDKRSAEIFLRNEDAGISTLIRLGAVFNRLRVVVKGVNPHGQLVVMQISDELSLSDPVLYERKFLVLAQEAHRHWETLNHEE